MNGIKKKMIKPSVQILKALADSSRLMIVNVLMRKSAYVEEIAEMVSLTPPTVSFHLKKMEEAGLTVSHKEQYYTVYTLNEELFEKKLIDLIRIPDVEQAGQNIREEQYRQKVINAFFKYGKLKAIPVGRKKRRVVLDEIAQVFRPGMLYPEKEVNLIIAEYHDDFCTIRRAFIDEGIMTREKGVYQLAQKEKND
ncbi:MAG TPA: metalloregulator ArsR/SmtB family transcription factor [Firmicutes bacterium]|nr:metalloregulator ArsR/SmtB family transcription factor [Bacillota bacterium]